MILVLIIGVGIGCIYALVGVGYSLIYRTTGVVNFAQGAFVMVAGMGSSWLLAREHTSYGIAIIGGIGLAIVAGLVLWVLVVVPLWRQRAASYYIILATLVYSLILQNLALKWLGSNPVTTPPLTPWIVIKVGKGVLSSNYVWIAASMVLLLIGLSAFLNRTGAGRQMRACAADRDVSAFLGIAPERVGSLAMALTAGIGGIGGVLITSVQSMSFDSGLDYALYGFVAAIIGGFESPWGAALGGIVVGVTAEVSTRYFSSAYGNLITFALLLVFLVLKPEGFLGKRLTGVSH